MAARRTDEYIYDRIEVAGDCWLWTGPPDRYGYGTLTRNNRNIKVHRWVYENLVGDIGADLTIDHLCRVRLCVNPDHLEPVTNAENLRRGKVRHVCKNGHRRFPWNLNDRNCKECRREYDRKRYLSARSK